MNTFATYVFGETLRPLLAICISLIAVIVLTEGLSNLDIIISGHNAGWALLWVTLLVLPQDFTLIIPLAVFAAVVFALNRMQNEGEIAVVYGAGVSLRRISRPVITLAILAALAHLSINAVIQPLASRQMRDTLYAVRSDMASTLVRESTFTFPLPGITLYASDRAGGQLHNVLIDDTRSGRELTYTAQSGSMVTSEGKPAMALVHGQVHRMKDDGAVDVLDFDRYVLSLGEWPSDALPYVAKPSDRNLYELFFPDLTSFYDQRSVNRLLAEGHARLSSPLLEIVMAMIGLAGVLKGELNRRGHFRQIAIASCCAVGLRLLAMAVQAACVNNPGLNVLQYALPIGAILIVNLIISGAPRLMDRRVLGPTLIARA
jgi:lipopolysaccharide export system permease protein